MRRLKRPTFRAAAIAAGCLLAIATSVVGVLAYGLAAPGATLLGPALIRLPSRADVKELALTFDDGPSPFTGRVLDILRRENVHATFFLCGANAERYPDLVRRIQREGHAIGNHTYSHPFLHLKSEARIGQEIDRTQEALERILGRRPTLFRPPFGVRWFSLARLLSARGLTMVMWTNDSSSASRLESGAIVLLHDGVETFPPEKIDRTEVLGQLPDLIVRARREGFIFVTVPEK